MLHHFSSPTSRQNSSRHQSPSFRSAVVFLSFILLSLFVQAASVNAQTAQLPVPGQLTGHENHKISLQDAASLTRNFRSATGNNPATILGEFFGKDALATALNQDKCIGLRIYYGKRNDGTPVLVFVGVDQSGTDMADGFVGEDGFPCPPVCWSGSRLTDDEVLQTSLSDLGTPGQDK